MKLAAWSFLDLWFSSSGHRAMRTAPFSTLNSKCCTHGECITAMPALRNGSQPATPFLVVLRGCGGNLPVNQGPNAETDR
jgi:hypothetical protein